MLLSNRAPGRSAQELSLIRVDLLRAYEVDVAALAEQMSMFRQ
jgi:hypothetical protein